MSHGKTKRTPPPAGLRAKQKRDVPIWDAERKELWFRGKLVKRYLRPAKNQWLLLDACQEEGWPDHVLDPLPPSKKGPDHSIRLRQAVRSLNRGHVNWLIHFECDHTGTGFFWTAVEGRRTSYTGRTRQQP